MKILYFASIREALNKDEETFTDINETTSVNDVVQSLVKRGDPWATALSNPGLLTALNQEIVDGTTIVTLKDELALMPPVTGG